MGRLKIIVAFAVVLVVTAGTYTFNSFAENAGGAINTLGTDGVAIKGYDPVAYFTQGGPVEGKPEHTVEHKGATWQFASAENKALFEDDPAKYEPAYGGYCAYGVAQNALVKIEPDAWAIRDGKLYLNFNQDIQKRWSEQPDEYIAQADEKWPALTAKN